MPPLADASRLALVLTAEEPRRDLSVSALREYSLVSAGCRNSGAAASSRDGLDGLEQEQALGLIELADLGDEPKLIAGEGELDVLEPELELVYVPELKGRSLRGVRTLVAGPVEDVVACRVAAVRLYV